MKGLENPADVGTKSVAGGRLRELLPLLRLSDDVSAEASVHISSLSATEVAVVIAQEDSVEATHPESHFG